MSELGKVRYIRPKELKAQYGIDRVTAWRWSRDVRTGFPKAIRLSPNISVYDASEIEAWFELQRRRHDQRDG